MSTMTVIPCFNRETTIVPRTFKIKLRGEGDGLVFQGNQQVMGDEKNLVKFHGLTADSSYRILLSSGFDWNDLLNAIDEAIEQDGFGCGAVLRSITFITDTFNGGPCWRMHVQMGILATSA